MPRSSGSPPCAAIKAASDSALELTIWSRQVAGSFSPEQEAKLKIAYADLAFLKGALPTSRAWYRKVADAAEYRGSEVHFDDGLTGKGFEIRNPNAQSTCGCGKSFS